MRDGWKRFKLKEVGRVQTGTTPSTKDKTNFGDYIPFVKPAHFNIDGSIDSGDSMLSKKGLEKGRFFDANSVLMVCIGATIGKTGYSEIPVSSNQQINVLTPSENFYPKIFYYGMISSNFQQQVISAGKGAQATLPIINKSKWENLELDIPTSIYEQKRIVSLLEKSFASIDQAKANIEKNIENAKELFQSKLNEIFTHKNENWKEKSLDEISKIINGYAFKSGDFSSEKGTKAIKITNVGVQEFVEEENNYLPTHFSEKHSGVQVEEGDLVIALTRTIISNGLKVAKIPRSYNKSLVNQRVAAIRPGENYLDPDFLYFYLCSQSVYEYVLKHVNTLMQPNLSIKDLKKMPIPICNLEDQKKVVKIIKSLDYKTRILSTKYLSKLNWLEELKKSILQKAFSGELTRKEVEV